MSAYKKHDKKSHGGNRSSRQRCRYQRTTAAAEALKSIINYRNRLKRRDDYIQSTKWHHVVKSPHHYHLHYNHNQMMPLSFNHVIVLKTELLCPSSQRPLRFLMQPSNRERPIISHLKVSWETEPLWVERLEDRPDGLLVRYMGRARSTINPRMMETLTK